MLLVASGLLALSCGTVGFGASRAVESPVVWLAIGIAAAIPIALVLIFSRLVTIVSASELRWSFGIGFPSFAVPLAEIRSAEHVRTDWWWGTGLRVTPRGMLYNVGGNQAVELTLKSRHLLIGSDMPDELLAAIRAASAPGIQR
jgi:hypothetical protein